MKRKHKGSIIRYSSVTPIAKDNRPDCGLLLARCPSAARILAWILAQELGGWHRRKKKPLWHLFRVSDARNLVGAAPGTIQPVLAYMEQNRWIRRRYRYVKGRHGCSLYIRAVLPGELFIWERDPNYKRKVTMRKPVNGFGAQAFAKSCAADIVAGTATLESFAHVEEYELIKKKVAELQENQQAVKA